MGRKSRKSGMAKRHGFVQQNEILRVEGMAESSCLEFQLSELSREPSAVGRSGLAFPYNLHGIQWVLFSIFGESNRSPHVYVRIKTN